MLVNRSWAEQCSKEGKDFAGRMEGFVLTGPWRWYTKGVRHFQQSCGSGYGSCGARRIVFSGPLLVSGVPGVPGVSGVSGVFPLKFFLGFWCSKEVVPSAVQAKRMGGSHSRWTSRSSAECGGGVRNWETQKGAWSKGRPECYGDGEDGRLV